MTTEKEPPTDSQVALRILDSNLTPLQVTEILGLEPSESHSKGDDRKSSTGRTYSKYRENYWSLQTETTEDAPIADKLRALLARIGSRKEALAELKAASETLRVDIFVGIFGADGNAQFELPGDIFLHLAELELPVVLDVYC